MSLLRPCLLGLALLAGCADAVAAPRVSPPVRTTVTPRSKLPAAIAPLVPKHGIYAAGGGLVSTGWRYVIDFDASTAVGGATKRQGQPSYGPLAGSTTKRLSAADLAKVTKLAAAAWAESPPKQAPKPTADYDEILIVADGDDVFFLEGYGPIRRPIAASAITLVRDLGKM
jgi:hypothetical protein